MTITTNYNNVITGVNSFSVNDVIGIAIDTVNMLIWWRNVTTDAGVPQWNLGTLASQDPGVGLGGQSLSPVNLNILPFPWFISASFAQVCIVYSAPISNVAQQLTFNFNGNFVGYIPNGFGLLGAVSASSTPTNTRFKQSVRPVLLPHHPQQPATSDEGVLNPQWAKFLQLETTSPPMGQYLTQDGCPLSFTTNNGGIFWVIGGTVTDVTIFRGQNQGFRNLIQTGQISGGFPMGRGDTIVVSFTARPTCVFMPRAQGGVT
jgi:hypothetical protein